MQQLRVIQSLSYPRAEDVARYKALAKSYFISTWVSMVSFSLPHWLRFHNQSYTRTQPGNTSHLLRRLRTHRLTWTTAPRSHIGCRPLPSASGTGDTFLRRSGRLCLPMASCRRSRTSTEPGIPLGERDLLALLQYYRRWMESDDYMNSFPLVLLEVDHPLIYPLGHRCIVLSFDSLIPLIVFLSCIIARIPTSSMGVL
jgi:hypothetical protein